MARSKQRRRADEARSSWWGGLSGPVQHAICLGVLLAVSVAFFWPVHFSGKALVGSDTVNWRAMAESVIAYEQATGEQALWAPNAFAGMPAYMIEYGRQIPQIDSVFRFLRGFAWPTSHLIVLLAGTYLFVFYLTRDKLAGVLAAVGYGLTTYLPIILAVGHNSKFIALCYVPWLAVAFAYALKGPLRKHVTWWRGLLGALFFAIALAVNLRAGHVQITYYLTFLLGVWWIVEAVGALRHGRGAAFGRATGWLALGSLLGLLMVAQPYLVNAEYKTHTIRGEATAGEGEGDGLDAESAMRWSQGPGELITLAVADAYGGGSRQGTYWGPKPFTEGPHYLGGIVLLLAGLALWRLRRNVVTAFGIGALLMVFFALGRHFAALNDLMYAYFPLFDAFRAPETWLSVVAFALAALAGLGLWAAARREDTEQAAAATTRAIYIAAGAAAGVVLLLMVMQNVLFNFEKEGERARIEQQVAQQIQQQRPDLSLQSAQVQRFIRQEIQQRTDARADAFAGDARRTLIFLVLAGAALVACRREWIPGWAMQAALIVLVAADLGGVGRRYLSEDDLRPARQIADTVPEYGFDRFIEEKEQAAGGPGRFRVLSLEGSPSTTARPSYFHESLGGYHGAKLRLYQDYLDHLLTDPQAGGLNMNAVDLLSARYVVAGGQVPGMEAVYRDEQTGLTVFENPDALPRAFLVGETEVVDTPQQTWARLRADSFDPQETALLAEPLEDFDPVPLGAGSTASVELQSFSPREIVWQVETDAPRLLVASEIYYPDGWHATVGGEAAPIIRADYLLRGVPVPAGEHRVVMRFDPASHTLGLWLSGVSTALVYGGALGLLGWMAVRRRREDV